MIELWDFGEPWNQIRDAVIWVGSGGAGWPQGNEDQIRQLAADWQALLSQLEVGFSAAGRAAADLQETWGGTSGAAFAELWQEIGIDTPNEILKVLPGIIASIDQAALDIEHEKLSTLIQTAVLILEIFVFAVAAWLTFGLALIASGARIAATRAVISQSFRLFVQRAGQSFAQRGVRSSLLTDMRVWLTHLPREILNEVFAETGVDLGAQLTQLGMGTRTEWDTKKTAAAALGGATGAVLSGLSPLGNNLSRRLDSWVTRTAGNLGTRAIDETVTEVGAETVANGVVYDNWGLNLDNLGSRVAAGMVRDRISEGAQLTNRVEDRLRSRFGLENQRQVDTRASATEAAREAQRGAERSAERAQHAADVAARQAAEAATAATAARDHARNVAASGTATATQIRDANERAQTAENSRDLTQRSADSAARAAQNASEAAQNAARATASIETAPTVPAAVTAAHHAMGAHVEAARAAGIALTHAGLDADIDTPTTPGDTAPAADGPAGPDTTPPAGSPTTPATPDTSPATGADGAPLAGDPTAPASGTVPTAGTAAAGTDPAAASASPVTGAAGPTTTPSAPSATSGTPQAAASSANADRSTPGAATPAAGRWAPEAGRRRDRPGSEPATRPTADPQEAAAPSPESAPDPTAPHDQPQSDSTPRSSAGPVATPTPDVLPAVSAAGVRADSTRARPELGDPPGPAVQDDARQQLPRDGSRPQQTRPVRPDRVPTPQRHGVGSDPLTTTGQQTTDEQGPLDAGHDSSPDEILAQASGLRALLTHPGVPRTMSTTLAEGFLNKLSPDELRWLAADRELYLDLTLLAGSADQITSSAVSGSAYRGDWRTEPDSDASRQGLTLALVGNAAQWGFGPEAVVTPVPGRPDTVDVDVTGIALRLQLGVGDFPRQGDGVPPTAVSRALPREDDRAAWSVTVSTGTRAADVERALAHEIREILARESDAPPDEAHLHGRVVEFEVLAAQVRAQPVDSSEAAEQVWPWLSAVMEFAALDRELGTTPDQRAERRTWVLQHAQTPDTVAEAFRLMDAAVGDPSAPPPDWRTAAVRDAVDTLPEEPAGHESVMTTAARQDEVLARLLGRLSWDRPARLAILNAYAADLPAGHRTAAPVDLLFAVRDVVIAMSAASGDVQVGPVALADLADTGEVRVEVNGTSRTIQVARLGAGISASLDALDEGQLRVLLAAKLADLVTGFSRPRIMRLRPGAGGRARQAALRTQMHVLASLATDPTMSTRTRDQARHRFVSLLPRVADQAVLSDKAIELADTVRSGEVAGDDARSPQRSVSPTQLVEEYANYRRLLRHDRSEDPRSQQVREEQALGAMVTELDELLQQHLNARNLLVQRRDQHRGEGVGDQGRLNRWIEEHGQMVRHLTEASRAVATAHRSYYRQPRVRRAERLAATRREERRTLRQRAVATTAEQRTAIERQARRAGLRGLTYRIEASRLHDSVTERLAQAGRYWAAVERGRQATADELRREFSSMGTDRLTALRGDPALPADLAVQLPERLAQSFVNDALGSEPSSATPDMFTWLVGSVAAWLRAGTEADVDPVPRARAVVTAVVARYLAGSRPGRLRLLVLGETRTPAVNALTGLAELWKSEGPGSAVGKAAVDVAVEILTDRPEIRYVPSRHLTATTVGLLNAATRKLDAVDPVKDATPDPRRLLGPRAVDGLRATLTRLAQGQLDPESVAASTWSFARAEFAEANKMFRDRATDRANKADAARKAADSDATTATADTTGDSATDLGDRLAEARAAEKRREREYQEGEVQPRNSRLSARFTAAAEHAEALEEELAALAGARRADPNGTSTSDAVAAAARALVLLGQFEEAVAALRPDTALLAATVPHDRLPWIDTAALAINSHLRQRWRLRPWDDHPHLVDPENLDGMLRASWRWMVGDGAVFQFGEGANTVEVLVRLPEGSAIETETPPVTAAEQIIGQIPYFAHSSQIWKLVLSESRNSSLTLPLDRLSAVFLGIVSNPLSLTTALSGLTRWFERRTPIKADATRGWARGGSFSATGAEYAMPGSVLDSRGPSTYLEFAAELEISVRRHPTDDNPQAWQPIELPPPARQVRTPVWLPDPLLEEPGATITLPPEVERRPMPEHALVGMTGLTKLYDRLLAQLSDLTVPGSAAEARLHAQLRAQLLEVYPARVRQTANGRPVTWQINLTADAGLVTVQVTTDVDVTDARLLGSRSAKIFLEWLRVTFSQASSERGWSRNRSLSLALGAQEEGEAPNRLLGFINELGKFAARIAGSRSRSGNASSGASAIHPSVQRFAGDNAVYDMGVVHRASIRFPGRSGSVPVEAVDGRALVVAPERYAYRAGLPVSARAVRTGDDGQPLLGSDGLVLKGDVLPEAPPHRDPRNPHWRVLAPGVGPGLVQDLTGVEELRAQVAAALHERGLLPGEGPHSAALDKAVSDRVLEEISTERLEASYDQLLQDGIDVFLHDAQGQRRTLRLRAEPRRVEEVGHAYAQTVVNLDIHSGGSGAGMGSSAGVNAGGGPGTTYGEEGAAGSGTVGGSVTAAGSTRSSGRTSNWVNRGTLVEGGGEGSMVYRDTLTLVAELWDEGRNGHDDENRERGGYHTIGTVDGATANVLVPVALLADRKLWSQPGESERPTPRDLRHAMVLHLDGRIRAVVEHALAEAGLTVDPGSPAFVPLAAGTNVRSLIAAGPGLFTGVGHRIEVMALDGRGVPVRTTIRVDGTLADSTVISAGDIVSADILFGMHTVGESHGVDRSVQGSLSGSMLTQLDMPGIADALGQAGTSDPLGHEGLLGPSSSERSIAVSAQEATSHSSAQIVGDEGLVLHLGQHVFRTASASFTVTVTAPERSDGGPRRTEERSTDHTVLYVTPESEEVAGYAARRLDLPTDLVTDAIKRYTIGELKLDRLTAVGLLHRYAEDAPKAWESLLPKIDDALATQLGTEFVDVRSELSEQPGLVALLAALRSGDEARSLLPSVRQAQGLPEHLHHGIGQNRIYDVDLADEQGRPVEELFKRITQMVEERAPGLIEQTPGLWQDLYNRFAFGRWLTGIDDARGSQVWRTTIDVPRRNGTGHDRLVIEMTGMELGREGTVLGEADHVAIINQNYHYEEGAESWTTSAARTLTSTLGRALFPNFSFPYSSLKLSPKVSLENPRSVSVAGGASEQLTRLFHLASFTPFARVQRSMSLTVRVALESEAGLRGATPLNLTGTVVQLVPQDVLDGEVTDGDVVAEPGAVVLPRLAKVSAVDPGPLAEAILGRLRGLVGGRVAEIAHAVQAALAPTSYLVLLPRMTSPTGHRLQPIAVPGRPRQQIIIEVHARISDVTVTHHRGEVRFGSADRTQHIAERTNESSEGTALSGSVGFVLGSVSGGRGTRRALVATEKLGDRDETGMLFNDAGRMVRFRVDHDVTIWIVDRPRPGLSRLSPRYGAVPHRLGSVVPGIAFAELPASDLDRITNGDGPGQSSIWAGPPPARVLPGRRWRRLLRRALPPPSLDDLVEQALLRGVLPTVVHEELALRLTRGRRRVEEIHLAAVEPDAQGVLDPKLRAARVAREYGAVVVIDVQSPDGTVRRYRAMPDGRLLPELPVDAFGRPRQPDPERLGEAPRGDAPPTEGSQAEDSEDGEPSPEELTASARPGSPFRGDYVTGTRPEDDAEQLAETLRLSREVARSGFGPDAQVTSDPGRPDVLDIDVAGVSIRLRLGVGDLSRLGYEETPSAMSRRLAVEDRRATWQVTIGTGTRRADIAQALVHEMREILARGLDVPPDEAHLHGRVAEMELLALRVLDQPDDAPGDAHRVWPWLSAVFGFAELDRELGTDPGQRADRRAWIMRQAHAPATVAEAFRLLDAAVELDPSAPRSQWRMHAIRDAVGSIHPTQGGRMALVMTLLRRAPVLADVVRRVSWDWRARWAILAAYVADLPPDQREAAWAGWPAMLFDPGDPRFEIRSSFARVSGNAVTVRLEVNDIEAPVERTLVVREDGSLLYRRDYTDPRLGRDFVDVFDRAAEPLLAELGVTTVRAHPSSIDANPDGFRLDHGSVGVVLSRLAAEEARLDRAIADPEGVDPGTGRYPVVEEHLRELRNEVRELRTELAAAAENVPLARLIRLGWRRGEGTWPPPSDPSTEPPWDWQAVMTQHTRYGWLGARVLDSDDWTATRPLRSDGFGPGQHAIWQAGPVLTFEPIAGSTLQPDFLAVGDPAQVTRIARQALLYAVEGPDYLLIDSAAMRTRDGETAYVSEIGFRSDVLRGQLRPDAGLDNPAAVDIVTGVGRGWHVEVRQDGPRAYRIELGAGIDVAQLPMVVGAALRLIRAGLLDEAVSSAQELFLAHLARGWAARMPGFDRMSWAWLQAAFELAVLPPPQGAESTATDPQLALDRIGARIRRLHDDPDSLPLSLRTAWSAACETASRARAENWSPDRLVLERARVVARLLRELPLTPVERRELGAGFLDAVHPVHRIAITTTHGDDSSFAEIEAHVPDAEVGVSAMSAVLTAVDAMPDGPELNWEWLSSALALADAVGAARLDGVPADRWVGSVAGPLADLEDRLRSLYGAPPRADGTEARRGSPRGPEAVLSPEQRLSWQAALAFARAISTLQDRSPRNVFMHQAATLHALLVCPELPRATGSALATEFLEQLGPDERRWLEADRMLHLDLKLAAGFVDGNRSAEPQPGRNERRWWSAWRFRR
ncbi:hypothetical protein ACGFIG_14870 [Micromonospora sp. NPDC049048]|uniref:WXG100-like domain-containing protein n=1 Tax=Micromonospora sp. NPDC049048 TaxID=3364263 RepID=UPI00371F23E9